MTVQSKTNQLTLKESSRVLLDFSHGWTKCGIAAAEMQNIKRWRHDECNDITHPGEKPISNLFVTTNDKQQKPNFLRISRPLPRKKNNQTNFFPDENFRGV